VEQNRSKSGKAKGVHLSQSRAKPPCVGKGVETRRAAPTVGRLRPRDSPAYERQCGGGESRGGTKICFSKGNAGSSPAVRTSLRESARTCCCPGWGRGSNPSPAPDFSKEISDLWVAVSARVCFQAGPRTSMEAQWKQLVGNRRIPPRSTGQHGSPAPKRHPCRRHHAP